MEQSIIDIASKKTAKEWCKIAKKQKDVQDYYFYNALKNLKIAIEKREKNNVEIWSHIAQNLKKRLKL